MVAPQELQNTEFSKSISGYKCEEVNKYVEFVVEQYGELYRENIELEKKIKLLTAKLEDAKNDQNSISTTIINAQKLADDIVRDAKIKASAINEAISKSFDEIVEKYKTVIESEQKKLFKAQKYAVEFKGEILEGYKDQVRRLNELIPVDSVNDIELPSVDDVVQQAINTAGDSLIAGGNFEEKHDVPVPSQQEPVQESQESTESETENNA